MIHYLVLIEILLFIYNQFIFYKDYSKEQYLHQIAKQQIISNEAIYSQYNDDYKKLSKLKHQILHESASIKEKGDIKEYLNTIDHILQPILQTYSTNTVFNQLLSLKAKEMEFKHIYFETHLWDDLFFMDNIDLMMMMDEIFTKSIQHISNSNNKRIYISTTCHLNNISIIFKVITSKTIQIDYSIIEKVIKKYNGHLYYELKDGVYTLSVSLLNKKTDSL